MKVTVSDAHLGDHLVEILLLAAERAVGSRGAFKCALSGGSLIGMLEAARGKICASPHLTKWRVFFADERWCPTSSSDSTYGEYDRRMPGFLSAVYCPVPYAEGLGVDEGASRYEQLVGGEGPLDLVIAGIGPDGHTASLFPPFTASMRETGRLVEAVHDSPKPPTQRITMTFPYLSQATAVVFIASGAGKADIIQRILVGRELQLPVTQFLECPASHFLLDREAAIAYSRTNEQDRVANLLQIG